MTNLRLIAAAGAAGFLTVALGAFGAHGLDGQLSAEAKGWWETATLYGLVHATAAFAAAIAGRKELARAGYAFLAGAIVFSGSLYLMALGAPRILGAITPLGGLALLTGWALVAYAGWRKE